MSGKTYRGRPSTDGTRLGADIAEVIGTDDNDEILLIAQREQRELVQRSLTGMTEEQREWEEGLEDG